MIAPQWVWQLAEEFRARTQLVPRYPLNLREALVWGFDLTVEEVPGLRVAAVLRRLEAIGCPLPYQKDRSLRGCLIAQGEAGWIFIDSQDAPHEKAFSLAHELAHFLRHHWQPRRRIAALGDGGLQAYDTGYSSDPMVRLTAGLQGIPLRPYTHLMQRQPGYCSPTVQQAEQEADLLALEILAPEGEVRQRVSEPGNALPVLMQQFGLPHAVAQHYAARLFPAHSESILMQLLKKAQQSCRTGPSGREELRGQENRHDR